MKKLLFWFIVTLILLLGTCRVASAGNLGDILGGILPIVIGDEKIGMLFKDSIDKQYGLVQDPVSQNRIQTIGNRLLPFTKEQKTKYDFAILNCGEFNACSIYGGHIRVNQGLLHYTGNSDEELAFILAHEICHQDLGHNKKTVQTFKIASAAQLVNLDKNLPALALAGINAVLAKRSRDFEKEADWNALEMMSKSGFKPTGAIAVFRRIEAEHKLEQERSGNNLVGQQFSRIFATHPEPSFRVEVAEDYLFTQKYGRTFKEDEDKLIPIGITNHRITGNLPIIMAHGSKWESQLTVPWQVSGAGIFNPSSIMGGGTVEELAFFFHMLSQGKALCLTADNDTHAPATPGATALYTYINVDKVDKGLLLQAIREGRTYASVSGIRICEENFQISNCYPKVEKISWTFKLELPIKFLTAPKIKVFRGTQKVAELRKVNARIARQPEYRFEDKGLKPGVYWYVLAIPGELVTSPITVEVTANPNDKPVIQSNWRKGIVHFHSTFSDNICSTLKGIALGCRTNNVEFIFMTDHADCFDKAKYEQYINECRQQSPLMIPGIEWSLTGTDHLRHLLVLGLERYLPYKPMSEEEFFDLGNGRAKIPLITGPHHLGDDVPNSEIHMDKQFQLNEADLARVQRVYLEIWVKGTPRKDPIFWINRIEIGRVVTQDDLWHRYEFPVDLKKLKVGDDLFHIQAYIPALWQTFDDCEFKDASLNFVR